MPIATDERFDSNNNRVANQDALETIMSEVFAGAPRQTWSRLTAAGIAFGRLTDLEDLAAHPQNRFITVRSDSGEIELMAPVCNPRVRGDIPSGPVARPA